MLNWKGKGTLVKILVSNDDGIYAEPMWVLARELRRIAEVTVVAPDREQSAVGTAVNLRKPLRVQKIQPLYEGIKAYSVEGTPSDSVIVALGKVLNEKVDLVISGINQGSNLGEDVLISGTVGAALAGYLRGFPSIAVSAGVWDEVFISGVAEFTRRLVDRIGSEFLSHRLFLNINFPEMPLSRVRGVKVTSLASQSHVNTVEEGHDGKRSYYMLMRQSLNQDVGKNTDIWAVNQGYISITPLHIFPGDRISNAVLEKLVSGLLENSRQQG
jgi:5'-nucleotidase